MREALHSLSHTLHTFTGMSEDEYEHQHVSLSFSFRSYPSRGTFNKGDYKGNRGLASKIKERYTFHLSIYTFLNCNHNKLSARAPVPLFRGILPISRSWNSNDIEFNRCVHVRTSRSPAQRHMATACMCSRIFFVYTRMAAISQRRPVNTSYAEPVCSKYVDVVHSWNSVVALLVILACWWF